MISLFLLIVGLFAAALTFLVTRNILRHQWKIGPPNLLAGAVAALAFVGIYSGGSGLAGVILLPYAAFGLTLLLLFMWKILRRRQRLSQHDPANNSTRRPAQKPRQADWFD